MRTRVRYLVLKAWVAGTVSGFASAVVFYLVVPLLDGVEDLSSLLVDYSMSIFWAVLYAILAFVPVGSAVGLAAGGVVRALPTPRRRGAAIALFAVVFGIVGGLLHLLVVPAFASVLGDPFASDTWVWGFVIAAVAYTGFGLISSGLIYPGRRSGPRTVAQGDHP